MGTEEEFLEYDQGQKPCLDDIIQGDDKDKFVLITTTQMNKPKIFPCEDLEKIICFNAVKCATALLKGETGQEVELNHPFPSSQLTPLHYAAANGCVELVKLFLSHNAHTHLRCNCKGKVYRHMLPPNLALASISTSEYLKGWTLKQSIFKMLINLCLPGLRSRLEVVKLISCKTDEVEEEICHYAMEGKLVELALLLTVARERVMSPSLFQKLSPSSFPIQSDSKLAGSMTLHNFIITELTLLVGLDSKLRYSGKTNLAKMCKEKQAVKESTLLLIEVFERAGDDIEAFLRLEQNVVAEEVLAEGVARKNEEFGRCLTHAKQVAKEVALRLKGAGFIVNHRGTSLSHLERFLPGEFDPRDSILCNFLPKKCESQHWERSLPEDTHLGSFQPDGLRGKKSLNHMSAKYNKMNNALVNLPKTEVPYVEWKMGSAQYLDQCLNHVWQSFKTLQDSRNNLGCEDGLKFRDSQSLCEALESLCAHPYVKDWTPKKSIIKLFFILCAPELRKSLNEIRLLAYKIEDIGAMTYNYTKQGKVIELATLLMVAREKLMVYQGEHGSGECMMIRQCMMSEIQNLVDGEIRMFGRNSTYELAQVQKNKEKMLSALQLLEMFEWAGVTIDEYYHSNQYKSRLTKEDVAEDIVCWLHGKLAMMRCDFVSFAVRPGKEESEKLTKFLQEASTKKFVLPLPTFPDVKKASSVACGRRRMCTLSYSYRHALTSSCTKIGSFHTFQASSAKLCLEPLLPVGVEASRITKKFESWISKFLSGEKWSSILLAIKRKRV